MFTVKISRWFYSISGQLVSLLVFFPNIYFG